MLYLMILRFCGQFLLAKLINFIFAYIVILIYLPLFPTHINSRVDTFFVAAGCRCRMPDASCRMLAGAGCRWPDAGAGCQWPDAGCRWPDADAGCRMPAACMCQRPDANGRLPDAGCRYRMPRAGCRLPVRVGDWCRLAGAG